MVEEKKQETELEKEEQHQHQQCCSETCQKAKEKKKEKEEKDKKEDVKEDKDEVKEDKKEEKEELSLEEQLDLLKEEKETYFNKLTRLKADFINFRQRVVKEKSSISLTVKVELIEELLPIIDNFERALVTSKEDSDFKKGIEMIYKQLMDTFKKQGVEPIPTEGEPFDPKLHDAMLQVETEDEQSGIIIEELQKGYQLDDKVIRPAMVKVAQ